MVHELQHIPDLAKLLFLHGVRDIIISPGSRNAPLTRAFYKQFGESCRSIVDERSAAYFALGQSLETKLPTVLICTSGTAALNYAPAVAEAYFQGIPLLVLTADRPPEWIGQQDNQAIHQENLFGRNVKVSYTLPAVSKDRNDLWYARRIINEAFHRTHTGKPGPVHINVPLKEPLYERLPEADAEIDIIRQEQTNTFQSKTGCFYSDWDKAKSILLVPGQLTPNQQLEDLIQKIAGDKRVVIFAEAISNLHSGSLISSPEVVLSSKREYPDVAYPDLVVSFGGQVVSKKIKLLLREITEAKFYIIAPEDQIVDTFQNVNAVIYSKPAPVLQNAILQQEDEKGDFKKFWLKELEKANEVLTSYSENIPFSDFKTFKILSENLPDNALVFAGNSTVIRYLSYFDQQNRVFYSNRGTSGIDGCLSTASGLASKVSVPVYVILGDLSFGYDSNALWNRELPKNLKIILINNQGGGIFHLLKGPSDDRAFEPMVNAHHPIDFRKLSEAFGLTYQVCSQEKNLQSSIEKLISGEEEAEVLEIATPNNGEPEITKEFFRLLNKSNETELDKN